MPKILPHVKCDYEPAWSEMPQLKLQKCVCPSYEVREGHGCSSEIHVEESDTIGSGTENGAVIFSFTHAHQLSGCIYIMFL
jgi:hypothetical protein